MERFDPPPDDQALEHLARAGSDFLGSSYDGSWLGFAVGGPLGAAIGAGAGALLAHAVRAVGRAIAQRTLSPREQGRTGAVWLLAKAEINTRLDSGEPLRDDGFFDEGTRRSAASEITEAILLAARTEYEELKIPYLATLLSSLPFAPTVELPHAVALIRVAESLSYRQLCLIAVYDRVAREDDSRGGPQRGFVPRTQSAAYFALESEFSDLEARGVIKGAGSFGGGLGFTGLPLSKFFTAMGHELHELMGLNRIPSDDTDAVLQIVSLEELPEKDG